MYAWGALSLEESTSGVATKREEPPLRIRATQEEQYPKAASEDHVDLLSKNHRRTGLDLTHCRASGEGRLLFECVHIFMCNINDKTIKLNIIIIIRNHNSSSYIGIDLGREYHFKNATRA